MWKLNASCLSFKCVNWTSFMLTASIRQLIDNFVMPIYNTRTTVVWTLCAHRFMNFPWQTNWANQIGINKDTRLQAPISWTVPLNNNRIDFVIISVSAQLRPQLSCLHRFTLRMRNLIADKITEQLLNVGIICIVSVLLIYIL